MTNGAALHGADVPLIGFGQVRHARLKPRHHAFAYPTYFLLLPMRSRQETLALAINRPGFLSFYDADHGDGRSPAQGGALAWLDDLLQAQGIDDAAGQVWLHCYPRVWGFTFKPVSFWYCHRASAPDQLRAIVVEVNNTFGERHCYVIDAAEHSAPLDGGQALRTAKAFHVSPFCHVTGSYEFRFMRTTRSILPRTVVSINHADSAGPLLQTSVSGTLLPLTQATARHALWRYPAMTFGVVLRIHWQAARLWLKRVAYVPKPAPPAHSITR